jgi:hypothetical protein
MFFEKLQARVTEVNSLLCVGLDPHPKHVWLLFSISFHSDFCFLVSHSLIDDVDVLA